MNEQEGTNAPKVTVETGELAGFWVKTPGKSDIAAFRGIPYAKPPVGELRWRPPERAESWSGVRSAKSFGPTCPQRSDEDFDKKLAKVLGFERPRRNSGPVNASEDCLYLNVYSQSIEPDARRPVMVWIHGGGFHVGSGNRHDPQHLVRKGVVGVSINYRLQVLGFLAHPELSRESAHGASGNYGLLDQMEALKWVKRNIAAFGGDPDNVTIYGESAGGMAVALHMISPLSAGLFRRGIAQSGIGLQYHGHLKKSNWLRSSDESWGEDFAASVGAENIAALRKMDARSLVEAGDALSKWFAMPNIDGYVFTEHPAKSFREGRVNPASFMMGSNGDEGWLNYIFMESPMHEIDGPIDTVEKYKSEMRRIFTTDADRILELYPAGDHEEMVESSKTFLGDSLFGAQHYYAAKYLARAGKPPYLYFLTRRPEGKIGDIVGASHGAEMGYVFGHDGRAPKTEDDLAMSETMRNYWVQFARTGDPNTPDNPRWTPFDVEKNEYMEFGKAAAMAKVARMDSYKVIGDFYDRSST